MTLFTFLNYLALTGSISVRLYAFIGNDYPPSKDLKIFERSVGHKTLTIGVFYPQ